MFAFTLLVNANSAAVALVTSAVIAEVFDATVVGKVAIIDDDIPPTVLTVGKSAVPDKSPANITFPFTVVVASTTVVALATALLTNSVVAICVVLVPNAAVCVVGTPKKLGLVIGAFKDIPGTVGESAVPDKSPANLILPNKLIVASLIPESEILIIDLSIYFFKESNSTRFTKPKSFLKSDKLVGALRTPL